MSVLSTVVVLLAGSTADAQYRITSWTTAEGLPQGSVNAIAQTPDGFLWVATLGGLARFDGRTFRTFETTSNPELPHSRFGGLLVDGEGQLWVTLQTGEVMRLVDHRFQVMGGADGLPSGAQRRVYIQDGRLRVDAQDSKFVWQGTRFVVESGAQWPAADSGLTFAGIVAGNRARWYRDKAGKAYRYEGSRLTRTIDLPGRFAYEDRTGRVWALLPRGELVSLDNGTLRTYGAAVGQIGLENLAPVEDADGTLWFLSPRGLVRFRDHRFTGYTVADGLPDNFLRAVIRDREGTHWVGTNTGLSRLIEQSITAVTAKEGLEADNTYPILQDRTGAIWIGGWRGLTRYADGRFTPVSARYHLNGRNVTALMEDRDGGVWVGTMGGVFRISPSHRVDFIPDSQQLDAAYVIYQSRGSDIWLGTTDGLVRYREGRFERLKRPDGSLGGEMGAVFEDAQGTIWVGHMAGLARVVDNVVVPVSAAEFAGQRVRAIHQDASGTLWFGTYDTGLFMYRDGRFTRFTAREGLPTNGAFRIIEDEQARFWISSNIGIYRVDRAALEAVAAGRERTVQSVLYGRDDGMASQECNGLGQPAGIRATDGRIWFPTQRGVAIVDPASMKRNTAPPPVAFLDVSVGGFPTAARDRIEIRSGSRDVQIRYAALTFIRPELARFKYRMEGLDTAWVDAGTDRTARYADLPFGTFRFRVIAANRDGVWNEEGAVLDVVVVPPFYRTTWFASLVVSLVGLAAFGAHRSRLRAVERRRAAQEAFARQLIESQEADRARIAMGLHDGLQQNLVVLRNWASMGQRTLPEDHPAKKRFADMEQTAVQALGEVQEVVHDLVPYHLGRMGLAASIREMAERTSASSGIAVTCALDEVVTPLPKDRQMNLFRILQEAVNNVVKHSGASHVWIGLRVSDGTVTATIRDDGRGFAVGAGSTSSGGGFGLTGMAERARLAGGRFGVESAPGRGTTVTIEIPASVTAH